MIEPSVVKQYRMSPPDEKAIVSLLVLYGEPLNKTRMLDCIRRLSIRDANGKAYTLGTLADTIKNLRQQGVITETTGSGYISVPELQEPVMSELLDQGAIDSLVDALQASRTFTVSYDGRIYLRTYREGIAHMRMALLRGQPPEEIYPWIAACGKFRDADLVHPYVEICGRPFRPALFARLHPAMQEEVMAFMLAHASFEPETAPQLVDWSRQYLARTTPTDDILPDTLANLFLMTGHLDDAVALMTAWPGSSQQATQASIQLLRGVSGDAVEQAASAFEAALKTLRKQTGKRNIFFSGIQGYLYLLAMIRSSDPQRHKQADACFAILTRNMSHVSPVFQQLHVLQQVQGGMMKAEAALQLEQVSGQTMLSRLFQALLYYWLGLPQLQKRKPTLIEVVRRAEATGFPFIAAQAAELLHRIGEKTYGEKAAALRQQYNFGNLCDWFERQEPWQRQLSALISLQPSSATPVKADAQARLIWLVDYDARSHTVTVEPREQKRDARGNWSKGRAPALKRLREDASKLDFLTPQDVRVISAIRASSNYYDGVSYHFDTIKALVALVSHPLVFWRDAPEVRVDILQGQPELLVKETGGDVTVSLQPEIDSDTGDVLVEKETPTRLRVFSIDEQYRRIGAILGKSLTVPVHAKEQVLKAVGSLTSLVTVQSDIGGGTEAEQVAADQRLHLHLLPYDAGLKVQLLVKPFAEGGPYYAPGQGTANVIAEIGGKRMQAQRNLASERNAATQLIKSCQLLQDTEESHGERVLTEPQDCLELLTQLQEHGGDTVIAWPEGEKFRLGPQISPSQMRLSIKSERDWFAASAEVRVDENTVLDLRKLLELMQQSDGRFVPLGDNKFLALTQEFHRRLSELAAFSEAHGKGVRVHPLAAFTLEDLADDADSVKADKQWKEHLQRLQELDTLDPQLPGTLQAELRDYQLTGYRWLARLAHWGVGACLADDMGLGKTVQTLALILARAPQGPTLVVAPTSVCTNWISEMARFAPTLKPILFGSGDRNRTLSDLQAFDVVVVTYGLLQQEAELFAGAHWHTIVLDEAQAIKNALTKRSQAVMSLSADFRMVATGTPLENHLGELWNLFRFINPGLLGSLEQFNQRFAGPIERQQDATARARLRRLIQPFILRRTKTQVLSELPSRTEIVLPVDLSKEETAFYETLRRDALQKLAQNDAPAGQKSLQILAEIMKLRRACCNPKLVAPELGLPSSKLAAFLELLEGLLENRHKALVFSQFVDHLTLIRAELDQRNIRYQYLDGATPIQERKKRVDAFQSGDGDVFLISLKAGGTGLNLTAADYVIHMDPWWNPAVEDQASDRAHRMGQQRPVTIYRLVARHTIEESIVDLHRHKRALADSLLEGTDMAGKISAQDMLRLLQE